MKWINALGLLLQFIAFWFAAPELLGKNTLKRFENGLQKTISRLPMIILLILILGVSIGYSVYGIYTGLKASEGGITQGEMTRYYVFLGLSFMVYFIFMIFNKKVVKMLDTYLAQPLMHKLIHKSEIRKNALIVGAILFTLGFLIQITLVLL